MGTRRGRVYILDFNGNKNQSFNHHESAISELSIDDRGEFIASSCLSGMTFFIFIIIVMFHFLIYYLFR